MKPYCLILAALLVALSSGVAHAGIIEYELKYDEELGPNGKGAFTFESCPLNTCPNLILAETTDSF